jgi:hypothetical protein
LSADEAVPSEVAPDPAPDEPDSLARLRSDLGGYKKLANGDLCRLRRSVNALDGRTTKLEEDLGRLAVLLESFVAARGVTAPAKIDQEEIHR